MKITYEFHDVKKELPKESGSYLCKSSGKYGTVMEMSYSKKHKAFNADDGMPNNHEVKVDYWAELDREIFNEN